MKNSSIKKQSNLFVMLSSFLCVFMIASVFTSNFRFKPTYSATDDCETDECLNIWCPYGPNPCENTKCYACPKSGVTLYIYDKSAADAKSNLRASGDCQEAPNNSYCNNACVEVCYRCNVSGENKYVFAEGVPNAISKLGAPASTECTQVQNEQCNQPSTPVVTNCYRCDVNGTNKHVMTTSAGKAEQLTQGTNCSVVADSYCDTPTPPSNPPTGTTAIIIAWIIGAVAIGYSIWYFIRLKTIR